MADVDALVPALGGNILEALQVLQPHGQIIARDRHAALGAALHQELQHRQRLVHVAPLGRRVAQPQLDHRLFRQHSTPSVMNSCTVDVCLMRIVPDKVKQRESTRKALIKLAENAREALNCPAFACVEAYSRPSMMSSEISFRIALCALNSLVLACMS